MSDQVPAVPPSPDANLTTCPACKNTVSRAAASCPGCGQPIARPQPIYVPIAPPRQFLAGNALACLLLIGGATWLAFVWLPAHDAAALGLLDQAANVFQGRHLLDAQDAYKVRALALIVALIGLGGLPSSFREVGRVETCRKCAMQVVSRRKFLGRFDCERCQETTSGRAGATFRGCLLLLVLGALVLVAAALVAANGPNLSKGASSGGGTGSPTVVPVRDPWVVRAERELRDLLARTDQQDIFARSIQQTTHPTGKEPTLSSASVTRDGPTLVTDFVCAWKGGLLGTKYETVVRWRCNEQGHLDLVLTKETSTFNPTKESLQQLSEWFRTEIWRIVNANANR